MFNQPFLLVANKYTSPSTLDGYEVLQAGYTQLIKLVAENTNGATRYVQVFDGYAVPDNGAVPLASFKLPTATQSVFDFSVVPITVYSGLVLAVSSTGPTLTKAVTSVFITALFV